MLTLEADSLEFEALLPNTICLPINNLPSLNLRFLACKMGLITLILEGDCEDYGLRGPMGK